MAKSGVQCYNGAEARVNLEWQEWIDSNAGFVGQGLRGFFVRGKEKEKRLLLSSLKFVKLCSCLISIFDFPEYFSVFAAQHICTCEIIYFTTIDAKKSVAQCCGAQSEALLHSNRGTLAVVIHRTEGFKKTKEVLPSPAFLFSSDILTCRLCSIP